MLQHTTEKNIITDNEKRDNLSAELIALEFKTVFPFRNVQEVPQTQAAETEDVLESGNHAFKCWDFQGKLCDFQLAPLAGRSRISGFLSCFDLY